MVRILPLLALIAAGCQEFSIDGRDLNGAVPNPPALEVPTRTEVVKQGLSPNVDILWVLDDSCSMREEQDKLARNLESFLEFFIGSGLSWHMGVITTDAGIDSDNAGFELDDEAGFLEEVAGYTVLTEEVPELRRLFATMVQVGIAGSGDEAGIEATFQALAKPNPEVIAHNRGINRPDAAMHVIVISDENDQSPTAPSELANYLKTMRADPEIPVTFSSIVGPGPSGCRNDDTNAGHGSRYIDVTNQVGGLHFSICEDDWAPILEALGGLASGVREEFYLAEVPAPGTLKVKVRDGGVNYRGFDVEVADEDLPATCADDEAPFCFRYSYDPIRNAIQFVDFVPTPLADIEITYALLQGVRPEADDTDAE